MAAACAAVAAAADGKAPVHWDSIPRHAEDGPTPTMDGKAISNEPQLPQTSFTLQSSEVNNYEGEELEDDGMEETEEDAATAEDEGWQRARLSKKRTPTRTDRVSRSRQTLHLRPLTKLKVRKIPRHAIASVIGRTAPSAELAEMATLTFDDAANCAHIAVYDEGHAAKLTQIDHITFRQNGKLETIEVVVELIPSTKNTIRGVIQIDPNDSNETIHSWIRCEQAEVIRVQKMGKTDRAIVTFDSATLPRVVKYYMELVRVTEYRPKRLVCFNCHSLGHMAKYCPSPSVCKECGRPHAEEEECESAPFCVPCKAVGHLAVSKVCPSRLPKKEEKSPKADLQKESDAERETKLTSRSNNNNISWAATVTGHQQKIGRNPTTPLPDNHPVMLENAQLKKSLLELRSELQAMRKELASLRKATTRRQSLSPSPRESVRQSRSRISRQPKADSSQKTSSNSTSYVTEQMLKQREAQIKFEVCKEWQKACGSIADLQGQYAALKQDIQQVMEQMRQFVETVTPSESKRKKKPSP